jgi:long-chain acyl-CoA synthetase
VKIVEKLSKIWSETNYPFLIQDNKEIKFSQFVSQDLVDLSLIKKGDVVAIIGDFNLTCILTLLRLIDLGAIIAPLTDDTKHDHNYFFDVALVDFIVKGNSISKRNHKKKNELIETLRSNNHAGLVLFSTGTTGRPKAILHDLTLFLKRYEIPRPTLKTINFLLFDHIGGINTLFHTLFNRGMVVVPESRTVDSILETCEKHGVELLPTTPTFLRLMLMSGSVPGKIPTSIKVITYGTERMDQATLDEMSKLLPKIDFRQTFGMSELGIVRVKSESRNSLFMRIGGEGVETRVVNNILEIRSKSRMLGYLNAPPPFDSDNWYNTKDIVEVKQNFYKIIGRDSDVINVGGLKFMSSDVEKVVLEYPDVLLAKVIVKKNPITGEHTELLVQPTVEGAIDKDLLKSYLQKKLQSHMVPKRIAIERVNIGHRFKKS